MAAAGDEAVTLEDSVPAADGEAVTTEGAIESTLATDPPATEAKKSLDAMEGHNDALEAISTALSPPPCTPRRRTTSPTSPTPTTPSSPSPPASIIGIVTFAHDPPTLDAYLHRMIRMWKGERALEGVRIDQTRRCWTCEWMDGCEWRTQQSNRRVVKPDSEEEGEFWSNLDYESIEVRDSSGNLVDW
uniref:Uncharacterized protein n=2 Tax=Kalmanozyma brasiliensis (strain GHG001) TaxID=1365824 RepID=V5EE67_KALBG